MFSSGCDVVSAGLDGIPCMVQKHLSALESEEGKENFANKSRMKWTWIHILLLSIFFQHFLFFSMSIY